MYNQTHIHVHFYLQVKSMHVVVSSGISFVYNYVHIHVQCSQYSDKYMYLHNVHVITCKCIIGLHVFLDSTALLLL